MLLDEKYTIVIYPIVKPKIWILFVEMLRVEQISLVATFLDNPQWKRISDVKIALISI